MDTNSYCLEQNDRFLKNTFNKYLIPTMLSVAGTSVNVFLDGIIVGQRLGAEGFAAVNLCMPVYLILCTLGTLFASGGFVMSSAAIGKCDMAACRRVYNTVILYITAAAAVFTAVGAAFIGPVSQLLSGGGELTAAVRDYLEILIWSSAAKMLLYVPLYYLRLDGKNGSASAVSFILAGVNILLDLLFVLKMDMGVKGAAFASLIAHTAACIVGFAFLSHSENFRYSLSFEKIDCLGEMIKNGSPVATDNLMASLRVLFLNSVLLSSGGSILVAIFSVINNLGEFALFFICGVPQTAASVVGIYSAEKSFEGLKIIMKKQLSAGIIISLLYGAVITVFADPIGMAFGVEQPMTIPVLCLSVSLVLGFINSIFISYYNCSGHIGMANIITVSRVLLFTVISFVLLSASGGYIWLFLPMTELFAAALLAVLLTGLHIKNSGKTFLMLIDKEDISNKNVLEFSVSSSDNEICEASARISGFCNDNDMSPAQTMRISLAIEEILTVMTAKCFDGSDCETFDLRAFSTEESTGIRIRCLGKQFNPLSLSEPQNNEQKETMSINLIVNMAKSVDYQCIFGANSLLIII